MYIRQGNLYASVILSSGLGLWRLWFTHVKKINDGGNTGNFNKTP